LLHFRTLTATDGLLIVPALSDQPLGTAHQEAHHQKP
jgi:hypothetical protein